MIEAERFEQPFNPKKLEQLYLSNIEEIKTRVLKIVRGYPAIRNPETITDDLLQNCYLLALEKHLIFKDDDHFRNFFSKHTNYECSSIVRSKENKNVLTSELEEVLKATSITSREGLRDENEMLTLSLDDLIKKTNSDPNLTDQEKQVIEMVIPNPNIRAITIEERFGLTPTRARGLRTKAKFYLGDLLQGKKPFFIPK